MSQRITKDRCAPVLAALAAVGFFGYLQPWIVAQAGAMTLNAFDLAEWASLVPAQRGTFPPLLVPFLLRLQPAILSLLLGVMASGRKRMTITAMLICLIAAAQLPPAEFVYDIGNLNYRQQFVLAAASLIAGFALLPLKHAWGSTLLMLALAAAGVVTATLGLSEAMALYHQFGMDAAAGAGFWIMGFSYVALIAIRLLPLLPSPRSR